MKPAHRTLAAIAGAVAIFLLVAFAVFYGMTGGLAHGGPATLAAAMAGLFAGGLAGLVALILLQRWSNRQG